MNRKKTLKIILGGVLITIILVACGRSQDELDATATQATVEQFATQTGEAPKSTPIPTRMPSPKPVTPTATPQFVVEPVMIPSCTGGESGDTTIFNELVDSLALNLFEADSYRYHTLYRYTAEDGYADDDLSIDVKGAHSSLPTSNDEGFNYPSQTYERSHVALTNLTTMSNTELIVTGDGLWLRATDDPGWMALDSATSADMFNLMDMFSPPLVLSFMIGGGGLAPGVWAAEPTMAQVETLSGQEVIHRCWLLPEVDDGINAYLIHYESIYTFLNNAEIHLWTAEDDTQLVRLALAGDHVGERLGEYEGEMHDTPTGFLLWMEISDLDQPIDITPPDRDEITLTITTDSGQADTVSAPINEFPLPADAELVGVFGDSDTTPMVPREYSWLYFDLRYGVPNYYYGSGWYDTPEDRLPAYETKMNLSQATAFYLDQMSSLGWSLQNTFLQWGQPMLFMIFERDGTTLPVILESGKPGVTQVGAILPPPEDVLDAVLSGWESYTTQNSDLGDDMIEAIAIDDSENAWIGTNSGLNFFDGGVWTTYTTEDMNLVTDRQDLKVTTLTVDQQGWVWVGTLGGLSVYDGNTWKSYTPENSGLVDSPDTMTVDSNGRIWIGHYGSGVSVFDGTTFTNYGLEDIGMPDGHAIETIAPDLQDRIWVGTSSGGVHVFDGNTWETVVKEKSPPNTWDGQNINDLAIDHRGWVWIGTEAGLSVFDGETWTTYNKENSGLADDWVASLGIDQYGRVWVATTSGRLNLLDTSGEWTDYTPIAPEISLYFPEVLTIDPQGRIWIGSNFDGVSVFTPPEP